MPSRTLELAVLDTSIYIENFRTGRFTQRILESQFLFRGVSVVIHELLRGARKPEEREFALELAANLRLYTPTERIWLDSGEVVARLAVAKGYDRRKIQELSFDALITLTARSIGATMITLNRQDFEDIQQHRRFRLLCWGVAPAKDSFAEWPFSLDYCWIVILQQILSKEGKSMAQDLEARVKELEAKVQELNDREAIRDLRYRYHEYVNEGKFADIANLFTEDGVLDFGHLGKAKGKAELNAFFGNLPAGQSPQPGGPATPRGISFVKQFIHNHIIHLQGDRGTGFAYLEAKPVYKGESFLVAARYDDEYVKQNGQWKFRKMGLTPYFMVPLREGWAQEDRIKMGR